MSKKQNNGMTNLGTLWTLICVIGGPIMIFSYAHSELREDFRALEARARRGDLVATPFKGTEQEKEAVFSKACTELYGKWWVDFVAPRDWNQWSCERDLMKALAWAERDEKARRLAKEMSITEAEAQAALDEVDKKAEAKAWAAKKAAEEKAAAKIKSIADRIESGEGKKAEGGGAK